jgi:hypothetical protein
MAMMCFARASRAGDAVSSATIGLPELLIRSHAISKAAVRVLVMSGSKDDCESNEIIGISKTPDCSDPFRVPVEVNVIWKIEPVCHEGDRAWEMIERGVIALQNSA